MVILSGVMGLKGFAEQVVLGVSLSCGFRGGLEADKLPAIGLQLAFRVDVATANLTRDALLGALLADFRLRLAHGGLGQAELGGSHLVGPAAEAAPGSGGGHAGLGALDDQLPLELGQRREDAKD